MEPPDETGGLPTQRHARGRHPNVFDPKPMGASGSPQRQRCDTATDSLVEKGPEAESASTAAVATRKRLRATQRREGMPRGERDSPSRGGGSGDAVDGYQGGESFEGYSPLRKAPKDRWGKARRSRRSRDRTGARNGANPTAGCGVQQTRTASRAPSSEGASAEKTVEAGRNGKNGTSLEVGTSGPKSGRRSRWEWTQGQ